MNLDTSKLGGAQALQQAKRQAKQFVKLQESYNIVVDVLTAQSNKIKTLETLVSVLVDKSKVKPEVFEEALHNALKKTEPETKPEETSTHEESPAEGNKDETE